MESDRHNWIVRLMLICVALVCWGSVVGLTHEKGNDLASPIEVLGLSASFVDTDGYRILPPEDACHSYFSSSTRTFTKTHRQTGAKHTRYGSALTAGRIPVSERFIPLHFSAANVPPGRSGSKPLFLCLRKLIL